MEPINQTWKMIYFTTPRVTTCLIWNRDSCVCYLTKSVRIFITIIFHTHIIFEISSIWNWIWIWIWITIWIIVFETIILIGDWNNSLKNNYSNSNSSSNSNSISTTGNLKNDMSMKNNGNKSSNTFCKVADTAVSVPDQACGNSRCSKIYHFSCLVDWFHSLPSSKTSFGTLFGSCPYCQEAISVRIQK